MAPVLLQIVRNMPSEVMMSYMIAMNAIVIEVARIVILRELKIVPSLKKEV